MSATTNNTRGTLIDFYAHDGAFGELSNFYPLSKPLVFAGKEFATSEAAYQHAKFAGPDASPAQLAYADVVRLAKSPAQCKILASQRVAGGYAWRVALNPIIQKSLEDGVKMRTDWESVKRDVMLVVVRAKFAQNSHCKDVLLSTGNSVLSEHTPRDTFWGDGGPRRNGANHLGLILMRVRKELREQGSQDHVAKETEGKKRKREQDSKEVEEDQ